MMQNQKEGWGKSESKRRSMEKRNVCLRKKLRKQFVQKKKLPGFGAFSEKFLCSFS